MDAKKLKVGDLVGIRSGTGKSKRVYKLALVSRLTAQRIVVDGRYFNKDGLREVGGLSHLELMTAREIEKWAEDKAKEEAAAEERRKNYNPADHDDHVQAALRAMRDKARSLCEKLQAEVNDNLTRDPGGAMMPHWWAEYLQVLVQIEESENALKSVGLSTTLKPSSEQRSLFK